MSPVPGNGGSAARGLPLNRSRIATQSMRVAIAAGAVAGGVGLLHHHHRNLRLPLERPQSKRLLIPQEVAEVICGAVGEIVQVAVLYPLDTIKVRAQASSRSAAAVVREMVAANGGSLMAPALWRQLYAGVVGASVLSVAVGALYYSSFCAAKRAALKATAERERRAIDRAATAGVADALPPLVAPAVAAAVALQIGATNNHHHQQQQQQQQQSSKPHGPSVNGSVDLHHDAALALVCSDDAAAARATARAKARVATGVSAPTAAVTSTLATGDSSAVLAPSGTVALSSPAATPTSAAPERASSDAAEESISGGGRLRANMVAAGFAALVGSLVEAPLEMTKHKLQAGVITGSMMGHLGHTLRSDPTGLFVSLVPFCLKSLPFDATELLAYSSLKDARDAAAASNSVAASSRSGPTAAAPPEESPLADLAIGAAAGAVAVVVSHPMDTVKTIVETSGAAAAGGRGPLASAKVFAQAGSVLVARAGPGALFSGLGMRLVEQVPSTALYWVAVEGMRRAMDPFVDKDPRDDSPDGVQ